MEFTLRRALESDKERIEELFIEMLQSVYGEKVTDGYESGYLDKFFSGGDDWIFVAESNGTVIGYLSIEVHDKPEKFVYLDDLSVAVSFRNKGVGTALIERAESCARQINARYTALHIENSNKSALRLYERLGYRICSSDGNRSFMQHEITNGVTKNDNNVS